MKTRNKILLTVFTVLVFVGIVNVHAITTNNQSGTTDPNSKYVTDKATLSVTGVDAGDQFSAYKILDAYYNQTSNEVTYEFTDDFEEFLNQSSNYRDFTVDDYYDLTSGNITSGSTKTTSTLDKLASAYASYIKTESVNGTAMNVSGTTASQTLEAGSYLVLPTTTMKVYAVMVGNLDFTANGDTWNINNETIVAKVSDAGVTKSVGTEGYTEGSYSIGDEITYIVKGTVPAYPTNATNKTYIIKDTISAGLDYSGIDSVIVQDGETTLTTASNGNVTNQSGQTVANIAIQGKNLTITFNLDNVTSTIVTVTYGARLNENVALGSVGNANNASLTYSNDPYGTGTYDTAADVSGGDDTTVYLYGLELFKYTDDSGSSRTPLSGAEFDVYSNADLASNHLVGTITTDGDGIGTLKGIASGTYYVKETKAPSGYQLLRDAIEIEIGPEGTLEEADEEGYYRLDVANAAVGFLPSTGSVGTIALTLVGLVIVIGAFYFFFVYRKKKDKQESK